MNDIISNTECIHSICSPRGTSWLRSELSHGVNAVTACTQGIHISIRNIHAILITFLMIFMLFVVG